MLVLTRKLQEKIQIGADITITVLRVKGNQVRVGIEAPKDVRVVRAELPRLDGAPPVEAADKANAASDSQTQVETITLELGSDASLDLQVEEAGAELAVDGTAPKQPTVGRRYMIRQQVGRFGRPQVTAVAVP